MANLQRKDPQPLSSPSSFHGSLHTSAAEEVDELRPFVGRIGGNRAFVLSKDDPEYDNKIKRQPDAGPSLTWKRSFDLRGFSELELWKQAILEGWASSMIVWLTGLASFSLAPTVADFSSGALIPTLFGAIINTVSLALMIFVAGPVSGGHINPLITISVFFARLATFPRAILYVLFQTIGATIGAFLIRAAIGRPGGTDAVIPGCFIGASVTAGEAFVLETMTCLTLVFIAFGIGLDPRQKLVYGPALGPILIGFALGLCTLVTGAVKSGYAGASMNPARCFGLMAAEGRWDLHWVHWTGAILAGIINGLFYWFIPPSKPRKI